MAGAARTRVIAHGATIDGLAASWKSPHARFAATSLRFRRPASRCTTSAMTMARPLAHRRARARRLESGFTLAELCALYLSRHLLESVGGTRFSAI
jgi:hypothetical protein